MQADIIVDDAEVTQALANLRHAVSPSSLEQFLTGEAEPYVKERAEARFKRQGDDRSGRWAPLAEWTKNERESLGFGRSRPINIRTGELQNYILNSPSRHGSGGGQAYVILPGPADSSERQKFKVAQQGMKKNHPPFKRPVPARPVLAINEIDNRQVMRKFHRWLEGSLERSLGGTWTDRGSARMGRF